MRLSGFSPVMGKEFFLETIPVLSHMIHLKQDKKMKTKLQFILDLVGQGFILAAVMFMTLAFLLAICSASVANYIAYIAMGCLLVSVISCMIYKCMED